MKNRPRTRRFAAALLLLHAAGEARQLQATEPASPAPRGAYLSPLLPGHHRITLNGTAMHYEVSGEGPLLVTPAPARHLSELSRRFTLLIYDAPAAGDAVAHLDALRRYLKREQLDLLGYAQGSAAVTAYAARYPEHVRRVMTDNGDTAIERICTFFLSAE
jgi:hypothetical protein